MDGGKVYKQLISKCLGVIRTGALLDYIYYVKKTKHTRTDAYEQLRLEAVMYHQLIICSCGLNRNKPLHYYKNTT